MFLNLISLNIIGIEGVGIVNTKKSKPINIINPNPFKEYINKIDYTDNDDNKDYTNYDKEDELLFKFDDI